MTIIIGLLFVLIVINATLAFYSYKQDKKLEALVKPTIEIDFFAKLTCWRNLTHRQRDKFTARHLGFVMLADGQVIYPDGSLHSDIPPLTQEKKEIERLVGHLIKDDDTDLLFYLMYARGVMDTWAGREN